MMIVADIVAVVLFILIGFTAIYCYNHKILKPDKGILKVTVNRVLYLSVAVVASALLIVLFQVWYTVPLLKQIRLLSLVCVLFPCAAVDYQTHKIPNVFLIVSLIWRMCIFGIELIVSVPNALEDMKECLVGAAVIGGFFLLMFFLFKNSVGMGDVKLFAVIGLYQGLWGAVNSVFFSLIVSFINAVVLLITRKKKKSDVIAFAPCIMIGTVMAISFAGM